MQVDGLIQKGPLDRALASLIAIFIKEEVVKVVFTPS
jgi:hypothetical protein